MDLNAAIQPATILLVEDDKDLSELIAMQLTFQGHTVLKATNLANAKQLIGTKHCDLAVFDRGLEDGDGLSLCRHLRQSGNEMPILMLTARDSEMEKVAGLESGADDYMTKPFSVLEFQARVRTLLRRHNSSNMEQTSSATDGVVNDDASITVASAATPETSIHHSAHHASHRNGHSSEPIENHGGNTSSTPPEVISSTTAEEEGMSFHGLTIFPALHKVEINKHAVKLTANEFALLLFLAKRPGRVFSKDELLSQVWETDFSGYHHTVCSTINRLRNKLTSPQYKYVHTVWGVGYKFEVANV